jgi:hypothetical protein
METIKLANLALRFLLELCALAALAYWGFKTGESAVAKIGLGIGAPLLAAVLWGTFVAPGAPIPTPVLLRLISSWSSSGQPPLRCIRPDALPWPGF